MAQPVIDWLDNERDQTFAAQRSRIETAKLLATFSAAMGAAVVATALQVGSPNGLDVVAVIFLALTALGAVLVILLDRTREVEVDSILRDARVGGWDDERLMNELRQASYAVLTFNSSVAAATRAAAMFAVATAFVAGGFAAVSLLGSSA